MWLIVGLGNPGPKYELTRHNFGFLAIDALLDEMSVSTKSGFGGQTARFLLDGQACVLLKPETFMNKSGSSVQLAMAFHKISLDHVIIVYDELDLPLGEIRIKKGGGFSGHNGIKDIGRLLGPEFFRIRLGIGRPAIKGTEADYVLHAFKAEEWPIVEKMIPHAVTAIKTLVVSGLEVAQRQCQTRPKGNEGSS